MTVPVTSRGHTTVLVAIFFGCLTFVVIALRLVSRVFIIRQVGLDDVLIIIAACCTWVFMVFNITGVSHGIGQHLDVVLASGPQEIQLMYKQVWISSMFYNASLGFIKCSVLALYARLGQKQLRKTAYVVMAICAASATANVLVCIFQCWPLDAAWDSTITVKRCVNINAFYLANSGTNIFTDLLAYLLPMNLVRNLQLPRRQKVAVGVMLCLGLFACVSSIIRISFIPAMLKSADATFVIAPPFYWSVIESNIGVLAASIPSFKPLAKRLFPRLIGESSGRGDRGYATPRDYHMKGTSGSGFSKLSGQNIKMNGYPSHNSNTYPDADMRAAGYQGRMPDHKQSSFSVATSDTERGQGGDNKSRNSNSSQDHILMPGKAEIVRTTEFTRTVEDGVGSNRRNERKDYYPGHAH